MIESKKNKIIGFAIILVTIPLIVIFGVTVFKDRQYAFISIAVALLSCIPFFLAFENKSNVNTRRIVILAVMIGISVLGRSIFAFVPFFKPVAAIVILAGIYFGPEMGFLCGAMSALISNFYFGQGPWTPFQMLIWGIIGLIAGLFAKYMLKNKILLIIFAGLAGVIYSLGMDIWVVVWFDGSFNLTRYFAALIIALPITLVYAISNIAFLVTIINLVGKKLQRLKTKYGI